MNETAKEKIKRKKKERERALLEQSLKPAEEPKVEPDQNSGQVEDQPRANLQEVKKKGVEVLEIYPISKPKAKWIAQGTVKIKMHDIGLLVRNIWYSIPPPPNHNIKIQTPFRYYRFPDEPEKPDAYVESITFDDKTMWKRACKTIRRAVLEHHRKEFPELEDTNNEPS